MIKQSYTHLFFDLDRTLWDYERNSMAAFQDIILQLRLNTKVKDISLFKQIYDYHNEMLWEQYRKGKISKDYLSLERFIRTLKNFDIYDESLAALIGEKYLEIVPTKSHLVPNGRKTLDYLKLKGYKLSIITNGFKEIQATKIESSGIRSYFELIITSDEVGYQKPNPEIFDFSLKATGADKAKTIMIGDDLVSDIEGAANFGIDQVFYRLPEDTRTSFLKPTFEISDIKELTEIL